MSQTMEEWEASVTEECAKSRYDRAFELKDEIKTVFAPVLEAIQNDPDRKFSKNEFHVSLQVGLHNAYDNPEHIREAALNLNTAFSNMVFDRTSSPHIDEVDSGLALGFVRGITNLERLPELVTREYEAKCGRAV